VPLAAPTFATMSTAVSKGLVSVDVVPSDAEVCQLVFTPGFSTAAAVTAISERGSLQSRTRCTASPSHTRRRPSSALGRDRE
jgi:hypothetical protein